jgi:hypothetical protein
MNIITSQIPLSWHFSQVRTNNNITPEDNPYHYAMAFGQKALFPNYTIEKMVENISAVWLTNAGHSDHAV